jgi:hypothetical protein
MFLSISTVRFLKKGSKFGQLRNRSSNLGQRFLLKVASNLGWREYLTTKMYAGTFKV